MNPMILANQGFQGWIEAIKAWLHNFFNPKLEGYTNFTFGDGEMLNIRIMIFSAFIGVLIASLYIIYVKNVVGAFVRKLLTEECLSEDRAMTLEQLGFLHNPFVRLALRGSMLTGTVTPVHPFETVLRKGSGEETGSEKEPAQSADTQEAADAQAAEKTEGSRKVAKPNPATVRYYIKEEKKHVAEMRFNARGSGWPTFFFVLLLSVIAIFVIFACLPYILNYLDRTISIFSVKGNTLM